MCKDKDKKKAEKSQPEAEAALAVWRLLRQGLNPSPS